MTSDLPPPPPPFPTGDLALPASVERARDKIRRQLQTAIDEAFTRLHEAKNGREARDFAVTVGILIDKGRVVFDGVWPAEPPPKSTPKREDAELERRVARLRDELATRREAAEEMARLEERDRLRERVEGQRPAAADASGVGGTRHGPSAPGDADDDEPAPGPPRPRGSIAELHRRAHRGRR